MGSRRPQPSSCKPHCPRATVQEQLWLRALEPEDKLSQNHGPDEGGRDLWIVQPNPSAQAGPLRGNCPGPCPNSSGIPLRWRFQNHFRQPMPVYGHPDRNKVLPDVEREPHVFQSVPMGCHWVPSKRAWLRSLYPSGFMHSHEIS